MKPCANTKQICSWQLWACTTILVFSALLPRLPALEEYLGFCSPPPSSLPFLSSQKGEARYSPNSCKREQRLQRRSGSDPPAAPVPSPGRRAAVPGALPAGAELHGALLPSCARRPPAAAGSSRGAPARVRGELYGPREVSGPTACFSGAARGGGARAGPRGETDAKMVKMRRSDFLDEKVFISTDFFLKAFP